MKVAIIGATGLVGQMMAKVLQERDFPVSELIPVASDLSVGKKISYRNMEYDVISIESAIGRRPDFALFSAGKTVSLYRAKEFASAGTIVIDNSSAWRMEEDVKLIVPEVNGNILMSGDKLIANPNCSTIQMVMAINPLHLRYKIRRIVVSTYQAVSGSGQKALDQMNSERNKEETEMVYPHPIDLNCLPHGGDFLSNNYTSEEMKLVYETRKIMNAPEVGITSTVVRVPVHTGHSESINLEFEKDFDLDEVKEILTNKKGISLIDDPLKNKYPMPLFSEGKDEVLVGRIRRDESQPRTLNMWVVADNLRKGAATNAVQIAEEMIWKL